MTDKQIIIDIILTIWVLAFSVIIAVDSTPCDNLKKAFIFCSSFLVALMNLALIWLSYLVKGVS